MDFDGEDNEQEYDECIVIFLIYGRQCRKVVIFLLFSEYNVSELNVDR